MDERIVEEVRTGVPYYDKKMAKDANGDLTGLAPKSMGEDGQFKYRRLPKDSYKQGIITDIRQMGGISGIQKALRMWIRMVTVCPMNGKRQMA